MYSNYNTTMETDVAWCTIYSSVLHFFQGLLGPMSGHLLEVGALQRHLQGHVDASRKRLPGSVKPHDLKACILSRNVRLTLIQ